MARYFIQFLYLFILVSLLQAMPIIYSQEQPIPTSNERKYKIKGTKILKVREYDLDLPWTISCRVLKSLEKPGYRLEVAVTNSDTRSWYYIQKNQYTQFSISLVTGDKSVAMAAAGSPRSADEAMLLGFPEMAYPPASGEIRPSTTTLFNINLSQVFDIKSDCSYFLTVKHLMFAVDTSDPVVVASTVRFSTNGKADAHHQ